MMNTEDKEVLIVFNDRRRPVKFTCFEDPAESYKSLVRAVENAFCDVLTAEEGSSNSEGGRSGSGSIYKSKAKNGEE